MCFFLILSLILPSPTLALRSGLEEEVERQLKTALTDQSNIPFGLKTDYLYVAVARSPGLMDWLVVTPDGRVYARIKPNAPLGDGGHLVRLNPRTLQIVAKGPFVTRVHHQGVLHDDAGELLYVRTVTRRQLPRMWRGRRLLRLDPWDLTILGVVRDIPSGSNSLFPLHETPQTYRDLDPIEVASTNLPKRVAWLPINDGRSVYVENAHAGQSLRLERVPSTEFLTLFETIKDRRALDTVAKILGVALKAVVQAESNPAQRQAAHEAFKQYFGVTVHDAYGRLEVLARAPTPLHRAWAVHGLLKLLRESSIVLTSLPRPAPSPNKLETSALPRTTTPTPISMDTLPVSTDEPPANPYTGLEERLVRVPGNPDYPTYVVADPLFSLLSPSRSFAVAIYDHARVAESPEFLSLKFAAEVEKETSGSLFPGAGELWNLVQKEDAIFVEASSLLQVRDFILKGSPFFNWTTREVITAGLWEERLHLATRQLARSDPETWRRMKKVVLRSKRPNMARLRKNLQHLRPEARSPLVLAMEILPILLVNYRTPALEVFPKDLQEAAQRLREETRPTSQEVSQAIQKARQLRPFLSGERYHDTLDKLLRKDSTGLEESSPATPQAGLEEKGKQTKQSGVHRKADRRKRWEETHRITRRNLLILGGLTALTAGSYYLFSTQEEEEPEEATQKTVRAKMEKYLLELAREWGNSSDPAEKQWAAFLPSIGTRLRVMKTGSTESSLASSTPIGASLKHKKDGNFMMNPETGYPEFTVLVNGDVFERLLADKSLDPSIRDLFLKSCIVKELGGIEHYRNHSSTGRVYILLRDWLQETLRHYREPDGRAMVPRRELKNRPLAQLLKYFVAHVLVTESAGYIKQLDYLDRHGLNAAKWKELFEKRSQVNPLLGQGIFSSAFDPLLSTYHELANLAGPGQPDRLWRAAVFHFMTTMELEGEGEAPESLLAVLGMFRLAVEMEAEEGRAKIGKTGKLNTLFIDPHTKLPPPEFMEYLRDERFYAPRPEDLEKEFGKKSTPRASPHAGLEEEISPQQAKEKLRQWLEGKREGPVAVALRGFPGPPERVISRATPQQLQTAIERLLDTLLGDSRLQWEDRHPEVDAWAQLTLTSSIPRSQQTLQFLNLIRELIEEENSAAGLEEGDPLRVLTELYGAVAAHRPEPYNQVNYSSTDPRLAEELFRTLQSEGVMGPGTSFVDLGSGVGLVVHMAHVVAGVKATGVEKEEALVQIARGLTEQLAARGAVDPTKIHWEKGDLERVDLERFDVVFANPPLKQGDWAYTPFSFIYRMRRGALLIMPIGVYDLGHEGKPLELSGVERVELPMPFVGYRIPPSPQAGLEEGIKEAPSEELSGLVDNLQGQLQRVGWVKQGEKLPVVVSVGSPPVVVFDEAAKQESPYRRDKKDDGQTIHAISPYLSIQVAMPKHVKEAISPPSNRRSSNVPEKWVTTNAAKTMEPMLIQIFAALARRLSVISTPQAYHPLSLSVNVNGEEIQVTAGLEEQAMVRAFLENRLPLLVEWLVRWKKPSPAIQDEWRQAFSEAAPELTVALMDWFASFDQAGDAMQQAWQRVSELLRHRHGLAVFLDLPGIRQGAFRVGLLGEILPERRRYFRERGSPPSSSSLVVDVVRPLWQRGQLLYDWPVSDYLWLRNDVAEDPIGFSKTLSEFFQILYDRNHPIPPVPGSQGPLSLDSPFGAVYRAKVAFWLSRLANPQESLAEILGALEQLSLSDEEHRAILERAYRAGRAPSDLEILRLVIPDVVVHLYKLSQGTHNLTAARNALLARGPEFAQQRAREAYRELFGPDRPLGREAFEEAPAGSVPPAGLEEGQEIEYSVQRTADRKGSKRGKGQEELSGRGAPAVGHADRLSRLPIQSRRQNLLQHTRTTIQSPSQSPLLAFNLQGDPNQKDVDSQPGNEGPDVKAFAEHTTQYNASQHRVAGVYGNLQESVTLPGSQPVHAQSSINKRTTPPYPNQDATGLEEAPTTDQIKRAKNQVRSLYLNIAYPRDDRVFVISQKLLDQMPVVAGLRYLDEKVIIEPSPLQQLSVVRQLIESRRIGPTPTLFYLTAHDDTEGWSWELAEWASSKGLTLTKPVWMHSDEFESKPDSLLRWLLNEFGMPFGWLEINRVFIHSAIPSLELLARWSTPADQAGLEEGPGEFLRWHREQKDWLQNRLAKTISVTQSFISQLENNTILPSYRTSIALGNALDFDGAQFYKESVLPRRYPEAAPLTPIPPESKTASEEAPRFSIGDRIVLQGRTLPVYEVIEPPSGQAADPHVVWVREVRSDDRDLRFQRGLPMSISTAALAGYELAPPQAGLEERQEDVRVLADDLAPLWESALQKMATLRLARAIIARRIQQLSHRPESANAALRRLSEIEDAVNSSLAYVLHGHSGILVNIPPSSRNLSPDEIRATYETQRRLAKELLPRSEALVRLALSIPEHSLWEKERGNIVRVSQLLLEVLKNIDSNPQAGLEEGLGVKVKTWLATRGRWGRFNRVWRWLEGTGFVDQKTLKRWRGQINYLVNEMVTQKIRDDRGIQYWLEEELPILLEEQGRMDNQVSAILDAAVRFWRERGIPPAPTFRGLRAVSQESSDLPDFLERLSAVEHFVAEIDRLRPPGLAKPSVTALYYATPRMVQAGSSLEDFQRNLGTLAKTIHEVGAKNSYHPSSIFLALPHLQEAVAARNPREFASDLKLLGKLVTKPEGTMEKLVHASHRMALLLLKARQLDSQGVNYSVDVELNYSDQLPPLAVRIIPEGPLHEVVSPFASVVFLVFDPAAALPIQRHLGGTVYVVVPTPKEAKAQVELGMDPKRLIGVVDEKLTQEDYRRVTRGMDLFVPLQTSDAGEAGLAVLRYAKEQFNRRRVIIPVFSLEDLLPILRDLEVPSAVVAELLDEYTRGSIGLEEAA